MKIFNLIENTQGHPFCAFAHGLSFYVETQNHRLLLDLGPSGETLDNAKKLGIDLSTVDIVILSHGHYDHAGGILPFSEFNQKAEIYLQQSAADDYYADDGEAAMPDRYRYIGIDKRIGELVQVRWVRGDDKIDEELELFTVKQRRYPLPFTNRRLLIRKDGNYRKDDFQHEQYLVIRTKEKQILMSGCAHNGILSILDAYIEKYHVVPDMVISGFHLMKKTPYREEELHSIIETGKKLKEYPTRFVTGHCTGLEAFDILKEIMGDRLSYVHSGEEIVL